MDKFPSSRLRCVDSLCVRVSPKAFPETPAPNETLTISTSTHAPGGGVAGKRSNGFEAQLANVSNVRLKFCFYVASALGLPDLNLQPISLRLSRVGRQVFERCLYHANILSGGLPWPCSHDVLLIICPGCSVELLIMRTPSYLHCHCGFCSILSSELCRTIAPSLLHRVIPAPRD